ncbi:DUF1232 domain-containing protein [Candidatus Poribacteria bacterium]|nr:DUF1232 domain-containing protein [Candidatus Poribacteria bacterium]
MKTGDSMDYCRALKKRISEWLESPDSRDDPFADVLAQGPELFRLLCRLAVEKDLAAEDRARMGAAMAYFVIPMDIVPEAVTGPIGYLDDIAVAAEALSRIPPAMLRIHWQGGGDPVEATAAIRARAAEMLGGEEIWGKLKSVVE